MWFRPPIVCEKRLWRVFSVDDGRRPQSGRNDGRPEAEIGEVDCQGEEDEVEGCEDCGAAGEVGGGGSS